MAGLTGESWLRYLDQGLDEPVFLHGPGQALESLPYRKSPAIDGADEVAALIEAVKTRLKAPMTAGPV